MAPALFFVAVFVLVPLGQVLEMSTTDRSLLGGGRFIGFANYLRIWNDSSFWRALKFTVEYTLVLTPILMGLGFALALLTAENTTLRRVTRTIVFLPVVIGLSSSSLLWFWLLDEQVGLFNKLLIDLHIIREPIVWLSPPISPSGRWSFRSPGRSSASAWCCSSPGSRRSIPTFSKRR